MDFLASHLKKLQMLHFNLLNWKNIMKPFFLVLNFDTTIDYARNTFYNHQTSNCVMDSKKTL